MSEETVTVQQKDKTAETADSKSVTVDSFRGYSSLPSEESDTERDMKEARATGGNHQPTQWDLKIQKMEQKKLQT